MRPENNELEIISETYKKINESFFDYVKILFFSFIIPIWISVIINGGIVLWKMLSWYNLNIDFWTINNYLYKSFLVFLIPIIYLIWFYHLTIKKILLQLNEDFIKYLNIDLGNIIAESLVKSKLEDNKTQFNFESLLIYINKKLSNLPKVLKWVSKKIIDQIPLVEFVNSYDSKDLENNDKEKLANSITEKLNEFVINSIDSVVPGWTIFIIPVNIFIIFWYISL